MKNYYNEIDPFCAQWLANLMQQNLIPQGDIDTRDIRDVRPADLEPYAQCHFFAGIGGWPLALRLATVGPDVPLWTGSCPCQPFSQAGRRRGFDDERHLWPHWHWLIAQCRPAIVFGEQVASASQWLGLVRGDLEALDYAVGAMPVEAASAGADHLRDRYWFVGHRTSQRLDWSEASSGAARWNGVESTGARSNDLAHHHHPRSQGWTLPAECPGERSPGANGVAHAESNIERQSRIDCEGCQPQESFGRLRDERSFEWVTGADGKARRVGTDVRGLVDGLSVFLGGMRDDDFKNEKEALAQYAKTTKDGPTKILQALWQGVSSQNDRLPFGRQDRISSQRILFSYLCELARRYYKTRPLGESQEVARIDLRILWLDRESSCPSSGWGYNQQRTSQHSDTLRTLSSVLSQCLEQKWQAHRRENAKALELLVDGFPNRVGLLRGFGNAIDPRPAAAFVAASFEALGDLNPAAS